MAAKPSTLKKKIQQVVLLLLLPVLGLTGTRALNEWRSYQTALAHLKLANHFIDNSQLDQAVSEFALAVEAYPAMYPAWLGLGSAHCMKDDHEKELLVYQRATNALPNKAETHRDLALTYRELGETRASLYHLKIAATCSPEDTIFTNALLQRAEREIQEGLLPESRQPLAVPGNDHNHHS